MQREGRRREGGEGIRERRGREVNGGLSTKEEEGEIKED